MHGESPDRSRYFPFGLQSPKRTSWQPRFGCSGSDERFNGQLLDIRFVFVVDEFRQTILLVHVALWHGNDRDIVEDLLGTQIVVQILLIAVLCGFVTIRAKRAIVEVIFVTKLAKFLGIHALLTAVRELCEGRVTLLTQLITQLVVQDVTMEATFDTIIGIRQGIKVQEGIIDVKTTLFAILVAVDVGKHKQVVGGRGGTRGGATT